MVVFLQLYLLVLVCCVECVSRNNLGGNLDVVQTMETCLTSGCNLTAKDIEWEMSGATKSVNPCDSFYQYACNGFLERYNWKLDRLYKDHFSFLDDRQYKQKLDVVWGKTRHTLPDPLPKIHQYFNRCMVDVDNKTYDELRAFLDRLGDWPVFTKSWTEGNFNFSNYIGPVWQAGLTSREIFNIEKLGPNNFEDFAVKSPWRLLSKRDLKEEFESPNVVTYFQYMVNVSVLLGADKETAETDMRDVLILAMNLSSIIDDGEDEHSLYAEYVFELYPQLHLKELLTAFSSPYMVIDDETSIQFVYNYYERLITLMPLVANRTIANLIYWSAFKSVVQYSDLRRMDPDKILFNWKSHEEKCTGLTMKNFEMEIILARNLDILPREYKKNISNELYLIKPNLVSLVENTSWLDNVTRERILPMFKKSYFSISYKDKMVTDEALARLLWWVNITGRFFEISINMLKSERMFFYIKKDERNPAAFGLTSQVRPENRERETQIPANSLQVSMYSADVPVALRYGFYAGGIYKILARDFRLKRDSQIINWKDPNVQVEVKKRLECQMNELSKMNDTFLKQPVQGEHAINRYVLGLAAMKASYTTFKQEYDTLSEDEKLPGMNYTSEQLFWLQTARSSCTIYSERYARYSIGMPQFLAEYILIDSVLRDIDEFSQAWNCPKESYMNHGNPCKIWEV